MELKLLVVVWLLILGIVVLTSKLTSRYWRKRYDRELDNAAHEHRELCRTIDWWQRQATANSTRCGQLLLDIRALEKENEKLREALK